MKNKSLFPLFLLLALIATACAGQASAPGYSEEFRGEAIVPVEVFVESETVSNGLAAIDVPTQRLVIRNADMSIVVTDPKQSSLKIGRMAEEMGGFIVNSYVRQETFDDSVIADRATITIRVPVERLDEALDRIRDEAIEVQSENVSGQDVTEEYTDLQSRLRHLEAVESELLEIMQNAVRTEDVLNVFQQLERIREETEIIKGRIQYLSESARLSSISIDLLPDVVTQPLQIGRWEPQGTAKAAIKSLIDALQFLGDFAIRFVLLYLPVGLLIFVPLWLLYRGYRRLRPRKKKTEETVEEE
jgi:hypothetical protein